jgi:hypothetical protein
MGPAANGFVPAHTRTHRTHRTRSCD